MTLFQPRQLAMGLSVLALSALGCHAKVDEFFERVYSCDIKAPTNTCGVNRQGEQMICASESQLGGEAFCTDACDPRAAPDASGLTICLNTGTRVLTCDPTAGQEGGAKGCPPGLNCYRTDLILHQGICLAAPICTYDSDCKDNDRTACAGQVLRELAPQAASVLSTNGLQCLTRCKGDIVTCATPGEVCLSAIYPLVPGTPDVCVPLCDGSMHCPPNFACSEVTSGTATKPICIPGLPGYRCTSELDCFLGSCVDTGAGFNVCAMPCQTDQNCVIYNRTTDAFVCVPDVAGGGKHCVTLSPFNGSPCDTSATCPQNEECFSYTPYETTLKGECRVPCGADGSCAARGGVPHVCLANGAGGCFPGAFGLPCTGPGQCFANLTCTDVAPSAAGPSSVRGATQICSLPCADDKDCDANPWTLNDGFCDQGYCRLGGGAGDPCDRDQQCRNRLCQIPEDGTPGSCLDQLSP